VPSTNNRWEYSPRGVLAVYMMGRAGNLTELHIANSKKYKSLKIYTQKIPANNIFYPKTSILVYPIKQTLDLNHA